MADDSGVQQSRPDLSQIDLPAHPFTKVPIEITVCVGKARPTLRELLGLGRESVLSLESRVDDPVELYVGERLIARGELQEMDGDQSGRLAVKLTEVIGLKSE